MSEPVTFLDGKVTLHGGDCRDVIRTLADNSIDSIVTDPPYALVSVQKRLGRPASAPIQHGTDGAYARASAGFMGKQWDTGETAFAAEFWAEVLRVLKPGGHVVAFSGTRTYHRMACAIEDAGFEIRDQLAWCYATGFPKSHNVSRSLNGTRCSCEGRETASSVLQCDVRPLRRPDVPATEHAQGQRGEVLHARLPEQGSPAQGPKSSLAGDGAAQPSLEGRGDVSASSRELCAGAVRALPAGSDLDGQSGRLCDGASAGDGSADRPPSHPDGMRPSSGSHAAEQCAEELGTLAVQSQPQAGGAWEDCARCGKPMVPEGLGTALKPAWEPICLARKPLVGTVAENVLQHGTGAINVDGCRVAGEAWSFTHSDKTSRASGIMGETTGAREGVAESNPLGRWPANIIHDGSEEVLACFPDRDGASSNGRKGVDGACFGHYGAVEQAPGYADTGSAARFFYSAKADKQDRIGSKHPTVKPVDLMQWLCRLVTPPGGVVLDPFAGSGSTGEAAWREGFRCILIEREEEYRTDIARRMKLVMAGPEEKRAAITPQSKPEDLPLFGGEAA